MSTHKSRLLRLITERLSGVEPFWGRCSAVRQSADYHRSRPADHVLLGMSAETRFGRTALVSLEEIQLISVKMVPPSLEHT